MNGRHILSFFLFLQFAGMYHRRDVFFLSAPCVSAILLCPLIKRKRFSKSGSGDHNFGVQSRSLFVFFALSFRYCRATFSNMAAMIVNMAMTSSATCAMCMAPTKLNKTAAMAIDMRVTSSAHALPNGAFPRGTRWRPWQLTWE
jgi:hypothetical protein